MRASSRCLPALLVALCVISPFFGLHADEYRYPKARPALVVNLPEGWTTKEIPGLSQLLTCTTAADLNYAITFTALPPHTDTATRDTLLADAARSAAAGASLTDITVSKVSEEKLAQGLRSFAMVHATGKRDGAEITVVYGAFLLEGAGRYFVLGEAGPNASLLAHKEEFQKVANSIQSLTPGQ